MQSRLADRNYPGKRNERMQNYRGADTLKAFQDKEVEEAKCTSPTKNIKKRALPDGQRFKERKALDLRSRITTPRLVFGTYTVVSVFLMQWERNHDANRFQYLIVDKGGLILKVNLMTLIACMFQIKQIFITSDSRQLPAYTGRLPTSVIPYGHRGVVHQLTHDTRIWQLNLSVNYRSHPKLVEVSSAAAYGGSIK
ncbi:unnamed protein product [Enterobius vermicularis]|uniref:LAM_G_DOMAIN domain-containing protein n=1 Tax=Enterobius vermicularis TaxID=51028 RepID=A0A0N4USR4_ENTVE|nr:unnamed protein product [Enterobius vermicularis]